MQNICNIAKETLTFLAFFDNEMIDKIPNSIIAGLCREAADSTMDFYIDINKDFENQTISEKSKDLISLIYHNYIADEAEKRKIANEWKLNDEKFESEKYNSYNLFKNTDISKKIDTEQVEENKIIKYKESLLKRIIIKIKNVFTIIK